MKDVTGIQNSQPLNLYIKGFLYSFGLTFILILLLTTVFFFIDINTNLINPLEFIILLMSVIYASIYITRKMKNKGWLHGVAVGGIYFVIFLLINLAIAPESFAIMSMLPKIIFFITTGFIGGCIGVNLR
ncbi:MAG: TIGR04086 family membrane protein [Eubacteriales bacterium]